MLLLGKAYLQRTIATNILLPSRLSYLHFTLHHTTYTTLVFLSLATYYGHINHKQYSIATMHAAESKWVQLPHYFICYFFMISAIHLWPVSCCICEVLHGNLFLRYIVYVYKTDFYTYLSHCLHNAIIRSFLLFRLRHLQGQPPSRCEVSTTSNQNTSAPYTLCSRIPFHYISKIYTSFSSSSIYIGQANIQQNPAHYTEEHEQLSCFYSTLLPCFASHCRLRISIGSLIHLSPVYQYSAQPILTNEHAVLFVHIYFLFNDKHSHTRMCV